MHRSRFSKRYYKYPEDDMPDGWVTCIMSLISLGLLGSSIYMLILGLTNTREKTLEIYSSSIANWTHERLLLQSSSFNLSVRTRSIVIPQDDSSDHFHDTEDGDGLPVYDEFRFHTSHLPHGFLPPLNTTVTKRLPIHDATFTIDSRYARKNHAAGISSFALHDVPLLTKQIVHAATPQPQSKCPHQQHGVFVNNKCEIYRRLASVCVQVAMNDQHEWLPVEKDSSVEGSCGCEETNGRWNPFKYVYVQPSHSSSGELIFPETDFADVSFTVRSSSDPYVLAGKVTHGSLDFGISSSDALVSAAALAIIGLLLAVQPACAVSRVMHTSKEKGLLEYDAVVREEDIVERMAADDEEADKQPLPVDTGSARKRSASSNSISQVELTVV